MTNVTLHGQTETTLTEQGKRNVAWQHAIRTGFPVTDVWVMSPWSTRDEPRVYVRTVDLRAATSVCLPWEQVLEDAAKPAPARYTFGDEVCTCMWCGKMFGSEAERDEHEDACA